MTKIQIPNPKKTGLKALIRLPISMQDKCIKLLLI